MNIYITTADYFPPVQNFKITHEWKTIPSNPFHYFIVPAAALVTPFTAVRQLSRFSSFPTRNYAINFSVEEEARPLHSCRIASIPTRRRNIYFSGNLFCVPNMLFELRITLLGLLRVWQYTLYSHMILSLLCNLQIGFLTVW